LKSELGRIDQTALRIARIVRGLKAFSRESAKDPKEVIKISSVINDALDLCGEKLKYHAIDVRLKELGDIEIACRPTQISQVLVNLLGNSFDAIQNLNEKWIEIKVEKYGTMLSISVTDSGRGIPADVAQKIMHPFFTTKEVGKGTGLGLSISKGLIEDHGGRFFLDSTSPNTRFVIELPIV
jgi:C4-dicarboxylate-specific signal transduction histidine kinase